MGTPAGTYDNEEHEMGLISGLVKASLLKKVLGKVFGGSNRSRRRY